MFVLLFIVSFFLHSGFVSRSRKSSNISEKDQNTDSMTIDLTDDKDLKEGRGPNVPLSRRKAYFQALCDDFHDIKSLQ